VSLAEDLERVSESLGVAAVFIQDMKEHRQHNYAFSWERMLSLNGDTGVFLQYTHARLHRWALVVAVLVIVVVVVVVVVAVVVAVV